jgi:YesN/AraC family two-component response regulator
MICRNAHHKDKVKVAKHGEVALEKLRERSYNVIVTDICITMRSRAQDTLPTWHHVC